MHSFTHIRALLVDIFAGRTTTITLTTPGSSALTGGRASEIRKSNSGVYPTQHSRTPSLETLTGVLKSVSSNFGSRNSDVQRRHTKAASLHHSSSKANSTQTSTTQITLALPDSANASSSSNSVTSSHQINNSKPAKQTSLFNRHGLNVTVGASHHFGGGGILTASSPFVPTPLTHEGLLKNQK